VSGTAPLEADIEIEAPPERVWTVVSDLARMGKWSPECRKVIVLGTPREGTHLVGFNRRRWVLWPTNSRIVRYEPGRAIAWKVFSNRSTWTYELEPIEGGTRLIERRDMPPQGVAPVMGLLAKVFLGGVESHDAELHEGMHATLDRIKSEVEHG
jgi:uncharacterized protein YndB with AHSA1/START domain